VWWSGNGCGKYQAMSNPMQTAALEIMSDQTQSENMAYFNYLGSMILNNARCIWELNAGLPWQKQLSTGRRCFSAAK
jgi:hypothetical protein